MLLHGPTPRRSSLGDRFQPMRARVPPLTLMCVISQIVRHSGYSIPDRHFQFLIFWRHSGSRAGDPHQWHRMHNLNGRIVSILRRLIRQSRSLDSCARPHQAISLGSAKKEDRFFCAVLRQVNPDGRLSLGQLHRFLVAKNLHWPIPEHASIGAAGARQTAPTKS